MSATCQCGAPMYPSKGKIVVIECHHCDRRCVVSACGACARLSRRETDGIGPKTP